MYDIEITNRDMQTFYSIFRYCIDADLPRPYETIKDAELISETFTILEDRVFEYQTDRKRLLDTVNKTEHDLNKARNGSVVQLEIAQDKYDAASAALTRLDMSTSEMAIRDELYFFWDGMVRDLWKNPNARKAILVNIPFTNLPQRNVKSYLELVEFFANQKDRSMVTTPEVKPDVKPDDVELTAPQDLQSEA